MAKSKKYKLNYNEHSKQWRKMYKGTQYKYTHKKGETKEESYARAWAQFQIDKGEQDTEQAVEVKVLTKVSNEAEAKAKRDRQERLQKMRLEMLRNWVAFASRLEAEGVRDHQTQIQRFKNEEVKNSSLLFRFKDEVDDLPEWREATDMLSESDKEAETSDSIQSAWRDFYSYKKSLYDNGQIKVSTFKRYAYMEEKYNELIKAASLSDSLAGLDSKYLSKIYSALIQSDYESYTKRDILVYIKEFVKWLYVNEYTDAPPRNLESLKVKVVAKEVQPMPKDIFNLILKSASDRTKLYVLLMLNCGMYQSDIANTLKSEYDAKAGTITRKRTKAEGYINAPKVTYYLWEETKTLLEKFKNKDKKNPLLITNTKGDMLYIEEILDNGKTKKKDNIRSGYLRALEKANIIEVKDGKRKYPDKMPNMKQIRKLGATTLLNSEYHYLVNYYLAHSAVTQAERHYALQQDKPFFKALDYIRETILG